MATTVASRGSATGRTTQGSGEGRCHVMCDGWIHCNCKNMTDKVLRLDNIHWFCQSNYIGFSNKKPHCTKCIIVAAVLNFPAKFSGTVPKPVLPSAILVLLHFLQYFRHNGSLNINANTLTERESKINAQLVRPNDHVFE